MFLLLFTCSSVRTFAQSASEYTWQQISGNWSVVSDNQQSYLKESRGKSLNFDYSPLINLNSIITTNEVQSFSSLTHTFSLNAPLSAPAFITFFGASDFRQFYGISFVGNESSITTVSFIQSTINDTTLPKEAKNNFTITTLASKEVSLNYGQTYTLTITVQEKTISAVIDNTKLLSYTFNQKFYGGKIGFASKNCIPIIDDITIYNGKEIVFADDFSKQSIRKIVLQGRKLTNEELEEMKKKNKK
ncbi:MAG: hypothetical protein ACUVRK_09205 [Spirochaetota bacterium]